MNYDSWEYCELLRTQLQASNVPMEQLCEGLCTPGMLSRICSGERTANKMMRDRLMQRLGLAEERNESFLFREEYDRWKLRQKIVVRLMEEDLEVAEGLINTYEKDISNVVEQQFCQVMRIQILQMRESKNVKLGELYENALKLTVPHIDEKSVNELRLSAQELDLVLEYVNHCHPDCLDTRVEELISYIEKSVMDVQCMAKILPKIIFYQCRSLHSKEQIDYALLLKRCNVAIECLRDAGRMFFLWELLREREWLYDKLIGALEQWEESKVQAICKLREENKKWLDAVGEVYSLSEITAEMKNSCYLYLEKSTDCINDVICKRRKMLGMTKKQLSEGICSEKTIGRLENKGGKAQLLIVKELFNKLRMSGEYQRQDIVTSNPEAYSALERIVKYGNDRAYDAALMELDKLEKLIPMDELVNQQYVRRQRAVTGYQKEMYAKEEALKLLEEALNITVSYEVCSNCEELYLTHGEMTCIQNMAFVLGESELNVYHEFTKMKCAEYERNEVIPQNIGMYEFVMTAYSSVLGNIGEYEKSDMISKKIIRECMRCRRLGGVAVNLYAIAWNHREKNRTAYSKEMWEYAVRRASIFSRIGKKFNTEKFLLSNI